MTRNQTKRHTQCIPETYKKTNGSLIETQVAREDLEEA